jgi:hypothetical protein
VYRCTPVRSLRSRRGRIVAAVAAAALGVVCLALSAPSRNEWIAPGPLSRRHAPLLEGVDAKKCAACHAAGDAALADWLRHSAGQKSLAPTQTSLCLECHGSTIDRRHSLSPHGLSLTALGLDQAPEASRRRDPQAPIACAACHREHHGADADLSIVADAACQACHRQRYDSFAGDHPDFGRWPYERPTVIAFDHAAHRDKHFPKEQTTFACTLCHEADATGQRQLTFGYEESCFKCHDKALATSLADGLPLLGLPTLDVEAMSDEGQTLDGWPEDASGDFEGAFPAPMQLLLLADEEAADALEELGPRFDFFDLDPADPQQLAAAVKIGRAAQRLVSGLAERGHAELLQRLTKVLGRELSAVELADLAAGLSPDAVQAYQQKWFPKESAAATAASDRQSQRPKIAGGGWLRDDPTLTLRRQARGHADPWMRAWADALVEASAGPRAAIVRPLAEEAFKPTAPGQCGSCHRRADEKSPHIAWRASLSASASPQDEAANRASRALAGDPLATLTTFTHAPHVLQPQLADCSHCHHLAEPGTSPAPSDGAASDATAQAPTPGDDFAPLAKSSCTSCHAPQAAGDRCTTCHKYHARDFVQQAVAAELSPRPLSSN